MRGKCRALEWLKSLLILLLSASALYLLTMTPLVQDSGLLNLFRKDTSTDPNRSSVTLTAAARPSRMAVSDGKGRYGLQYDQDAVDGLFVRMGPLLGEALVSSGESEEISELQWQWYLQGKGIYFDFAGEVPLAALSSWLQPEQECALTASARRILLVDGHEDSVLLCYQNVADGRFYACRTGLLWSLHMEPEVSGTADNGAWFAFEDSDWADLLQPYTLITEDPVLQIYTASVPLMSKGSRSDLLEALDYTGRNHASVSGGELYLDGNDRLHVMDSGLVSYDAVQSGKYAVATEDGSVTMAEAIEAARKLAERTIGAQCGDAELYLVSAEETEQGYRIRFGYRLNGSTVWLYDEGWAAEFYVSGGFITKFTLQFRCYTATGDEAMLLPIERAAVILPGLDRENGELLLQYRDQGESVVEPGWVAK